MAEIVIDRVRKSYGPLTVLKDFSIEVADGEGQLRRAAGTLK